MELKSNLWTATIPFTKEAFATHMVLRTNPLQRAHILSVVPH